MKIPPVISIITPVYNGAPYLGACIESVLTQTFREFELILVDDGSTDASGDICEAYARQDGRLRVIHIPHSGPARARNTGINAAQGDYLGFIDADDWIEPDMYALLYKNSVSYEAELSACGFIKVYDYAQIEFHSKNEPSRCYTPEKALEAMFYPNHMRYSACNKLFARRLFESVRYPEVGFMEDKATTYRLIHLSNRVAWCPSPKYHYFMRPGSLMHTAYSEQNLDVFTVNDSLLAFINSHYPALNRIAGTSYAVECLRLMRRMKDSRFFDAAVYEMCVACLRRNLLHCITEKSINLRTTFSVFLASLFPGRFKYRAPHHK